MKRAAILLTLALAVSSCETAHATTEPPKRSTTLAQPMRLTPDAGTKNPASSTWRRVGTYKVEWRAVSSDTHPITGNFSFKVK